MFRAMLFSALIVPQLFELTLETSMPHLEESLRYTVKRETRCVSEQDLATIFPVLSQPALRSCRLEESSRKEDMLAFVLVCPGKGATTGAAIWERRAGGLHGKLDVTLGGKNMTFTQRIRGKAVGGCPLSTPSAASTSSR